MKRGYAWKGGASRSALRVLILVGFYVFSLCAVSLSSASAQENGRLRHAE